LILRRALVTLHLWLGLSIGLLWALQGLTGAWLVFHRDVERVGVAVAAGPMISLDRIAQVAPGAIRVSIADGRRDLLVAATKGEDVVIEASTGRIVAPPPVTALNETFYHFHEELLAGENGKTFIGVSGLLLLSSALMGLWIGWPRGGWRAAFSPGRWRTVKTRLYGWHRAVGLLACIALVTVGTTGPMMIFGKQLRSWFTQPVAKVEPVERLPVPAVSPERAWRIAQARFPDATFVRLTFPSAKSPVWQVRMHRPGEWRAWSGATAVTIDPQSGAILGAYDAAAGPLPNRILDAAFPLHNGEVAGLTGRILMILAGLSLPMFYVTGVLAWWRSRQRRRSHAKIDAQPATAI